MAGHRRRDVVQREPPGPEAAVEIAARFLGTRPRSRWEVERRLLRAKVDPEVVDATLGRLAHLGYVDDLAFARWWLEQRDRHAPRGWRMVESELRQHRVGRDVIEALRDELAHYAGDLPAPRADEDGLAEAGFGHDPTAATEDERAEAALTRHLRGRALPADRAAQQRIGMFLMRRGFSSETVRRAMRVAEDPAAD